MQITKELLDQEIAAMQAKVAQSEQQIELVKASANKLAGALVVLQDLRKYMDREEEVILPTTAISDENAAIQARDEEALSLQQVAELIGGEGATADEPMELQKLIQDAEEESEYANRND